MKERTAHILTLMVDNEFGVLTRITSQIRREGWNIKSLAVAESADPAISRITVALECFDATLPTVLHRLSRLACVRSVTAYEPERYVCRELLVAKLDAPEKLEALQETYVFRVIGDTNGAVLELAGTPQELDAFVLALEKLGEKNIARTGPITLER